MSFSWNDVVLFVAILLAVVVLVATGHATAAVFVALFSALSLGGEPKPGQGGTP